MKLESTIRSMILRWPFIFSNRARALDQLFCVIGTGMEWRGGEIVYEKGYEIRKSLAQHRKDSIEDSIGARLGGARARAEMLGEQFDEKKVRRACIAEEKRVFAYADKNIRELCHNDNLGWYAPWEQHMARFEPYVSFYPLCNYSHLLCIPPDVKPDWLAGAIEVCRLILALPSIVEGDKAVWDKDNRRHACAVLKKLAQ